MQKLERLRQELERCDLDGYFLPMAGVHRMGYTPPWECRLNWLTEFSGSAGFCLVLKERGALFVDGRYETQAQKEVDSSLWEIVSAKKDEPRAWLEKAGGREARIGFDPWLCSAQEVKSYKTFVPVSPNLIDIIWEQRPPEELFPLKAHPLMYAYETVSQKINTLAQKLEAPFCLLTSPPSIAWLTNTRGCDVPYTPCSLCFALLHKEGFVELFLKQDQLPREALEENIHIKPYEDFFDRLISLKGEAIQLDEQQCPFFIANFLAQAGAHLIFKTDPCLLPKAIKNSKEIENARQAHLFDGIALTRFLAWFEKEALQGNLDECQAVDQLASFREENKAFCGLSFPTIAAFGENGAIVHYRPTAEKNKKIRPANLFLLDSGGQYPHGTTDVTRTVCVGDPTPEQKLHFTLVLKGHVHLATACFPKGTNGEQLDVLARIFLWRKGLNYNHSTGHGVGSYLSVHEGPQYIGKGGQTPLQAGMILSNEPGFYLPNAYGIRLENLMLVVEEEGMLKFETLTLAPFDKRLIVWEYIEPFEKEWLMSYHQYVVDALSPHLDLQTQQWLKEYSCL